MSLGPSLAPCVCCLDLFWTASPRLHPSCLNIVPLSSGAYLVPSGVHNTNLLDTELAGRSRAGSPVKMRFSIALPIVLSVVGFVLAMLAVFAGNKPASWKTTTS